MPVSQNSDGNTPKNSITQPLRLLATGNSLLLTQTDIDILVVTFFTSSLKVRFSSSATPRNLTVETFGPLNFYVIDAYGAFRQPKFEYGCRELLVFWVCSARQIFYVYHNPNLVDCIDDCLLTAMAAVQTEEVRASFMFVGDLNGHHQE